MSYVEAATRTGCMEYIEAPERRRRSRVAGLVARVRDGRLPESALHGDMEGGQWCVGGQELDRLRRLKMIFIEAPVRRRRSCVAGLVARMIGGKLPKIAVRGDMKGDQWYVRGQDFDRLRRLTEDCEAFGLKFTRSG